MKKSKPKKSKKEQEQLNIISKPFCDCTQQCCCQNCPDIAEEIGLPNINDVKVIPKVKKAKGKKKSENTEDFTQKNASTGTVREKKRPSLMEVLKNDEVCNCETVARALRSNVHENLNIHENRARHSKDIE